jgi:hypothetical protein
MFNYSSNVGINKYKTSSSFIFGIIFPPVCFLFHEFVDKHIFLIVVYGTIKN